MYGLLNEKMFWAESIFLYKRPVCFRPQVSCVTNKDSSKSQLCKTHLHIIIYMSWKVMLSLLYWPYGPYGGIQTST